MHLMLSIGRYTLLLLIGVSITILWLYCHTFLPIEFTPKQLSNAAAERFAGIATLVVLFAAPALPIYLLFRKQAVLAAMIIGWFPLLVSTALAYRPNQVGGHGLELVFAVVEGIACWGALVLGVWLASCLHAATSPPS